MTRVIKKIAINAPIGLVYAIITDMARYPKLMKDVTALTVQERTRTVTKTEWVADVDGMVFVWTERDEFFPDEYLIRYTLIKCVDLDKFDGYWKLASTKKGTNLELLVDYEFGIDSLEELVGPTVLKLIGDNSDMMLKAIKDEAETAPADRVTEILATYNAHFPDHPLPEAALVRCA